MPAGNPNKIAYPIDPLMSVVSGQIVVGERWSIPRVAQAMAAHRAECVVVCDGRIPTGIISEADVTRWVADGLGASVHGGLAGEIMWPPLTVRRDVTVSEAAALVGDGEARRLVVVNADGTLAGLLTESVLLRAELQQVRRGMDERSLADELLGIGNHRAMAADLLRAHKLVERHGGTYSVALFDFDCMRAYNDRYGYAAGNVVLQRCTARLSAAMRASDCAYRFGGAAVLVFLPQTDRSGALRAAHRMRKAIESQQIPHLGNPHGCVTVSAGAACCEGTADWEQVIVVVERGLALAKEDGRNAVRGADPDVVAAA